MTNLTHQLLESLTYDPEKGLIFWLSGRRAFFSKHPKGYLMGTFKGKKYLAHRVLWLLHHKQWPKGQIDHIDGDRCNNSLSNLRDIPKADNDRNRGKNCNNSSGATGVHWDKRVKKWQVRITDSKGKRRTLATLQDFEAAVQLRKTWERQEGYHKNHGRDM